MDEPVNLKVTELKTDMTKQVANLDQNYLTLHTNIDVIAATVTKIVESYNSTSTKFNAKIESDSKVFTMMEDFLGSLKESLSKLDLPN